MRGRNTVLVNLAKYGGCAAFTELLVLAYLLPREYSIASLQDKYRMLCDAFTIPGLFMCLLGALVWVSNEGAFTGLSYCMRMAICALIPGKRKDGYEKYGDYVERKAQKKVTGYAFLIYSGAAVLAVAIVFLILYNLQ